MLTEIDQLLEEHKQDLADHGMQFIEDLCEHEHEVVEDMLDDLELDDCVNMLLEAGLIDNPDYH